jgi:hypothetical protein
MGHIAKTDAELVEASRRGEREAFGLLVSRYQDVVCAVSFSSTGNWVLSEDVAQDTFIAAWHQLGQLRETSRLRSWLCGIARNLADLGFPIVATRGTAAYLRAHGISVDVVFKVNEGRPNIVDHILNNQVQIIVNTPLGRESFFDDRAMRPVAMLHNVPCNTTLTGASAAVEANRAVRTHALDVRAIQDYHSEIAARPE